MLRNFINQMFAGFIKINQWRIFDMDTSLSNFSAAAGRKIIYSWPAVSVLKGIAVYFIILYAVSV